MKLIASLFLVCLSIGCSGPYDDLEIAFPAPSEPFEEMKKANLIVLTSTTHKGAYSLRDLAQYGLSTDFLVISTAMPASLAYKPIQIPIEAISGCGKTCFGPERWDADILLGKQGIEISIERAEDVIEWCWKNGLPMITGKNKREWMYNGGSLPSRDGYKQVDREEYAQQTKTRCMGY